MGHPLERAALFVKQNSNCPTCARETGEAPVSNLSLTASGRPYSVGLERLGPRPWVALGVDMDYFEQVVQLCRTVLERSRNGTATAGYTILTPEARVAMVFDFMKHGMLLNLMIAHDDYTLARLWGDIADDTARIDIHHLLAPVVAASKMLAPISVRDSKAKTSFWREYMPLGVTVGVDCSIKPIQRRRLEAADYRG